MTEPSRRILVVYTGGTFGMTEGPRGFEPLAGFLEEQLLERPRFHVPNAPRLTFPATASGRTARYDILEYEPLLDSSNMEMTDWVRIANDIAEHYEHYDAFVIIHGTDTMAYTASALSFMLVNLGKTVVITGSQVPLAQPRNDAVDNLLGALTIATDYDLPEVCLYFRNRLFRGNRSQKVDASGFKAFDSGNLPPLGLMETEINLRWDLIRTPQEGAFRVRPITCANVASMRLFPGMTAETLERVLQPPLQGVVLETFGAGNGPDNRPEFLDVLRKATDRGLVIVSVTQCHKGTVRPDYAAGTALAEAGVLSGADMTPEAALTKLAYLLSQQIPITQVRRFISVDLRGELTPQNTIPRHSFKEQRFMRSVMSSLSDASEVSVRRSLYPVLLCAAARANDLGAIQRMIQEGADPNHGDHDHRTPLQVAAAEGHAQIVTYLLSHGAAVNQEDRWGATPWTEAYLAGHEYLLVLLETNGARRPSVESLERLAQRTTPEGWQRLQQLLPKD